MARYVCDFDAVRDGCKKLEDTIANLESNVKKDKSNLDSDLINWSGSASSSFKASSNGITNNLQNEINSMRELSEGISKKASAIEELDNAIASIKF